MRIVVNDIAASKTGALAILMDFYEYVKENCGEHEWIFLTGGGYLKPCGHISVNVLEYVKRSQKDRLYFDLVSGKKYIESLEPDVVFSLQNTLTSGSIRRLRDGEYGRKGEKVPQVLYVHQPLGFQKTKRFSFFDREEREYAVYQYLIGSLIDASVKRADRVIVQTEWMREAVAGKDHVSLDKIIKVLPQVPDLTEYRPENTGDVWNNKSFFFPSGEILYKNHECVLKAAGILNDKGIEDFKVHFTLKGLSDVTARTYPDPHGNIIWSGRVSREEVIREYGRSTLIFPSYIETFGVPLAEARQIGTLILASDCPFCHEVLSGYENVRYFDPFDEKALASLMEDVILGKLALESTADESRQNMSAGNKNSYGEIVDIIVNSVR